MLHSTLLRERDVQLICRQHKADQFSERTCYVGITARPAGNDLFTSTADGIFTTNQRNGPWVEGCHFQGIGDDAVVLKNNVAANETITANLFIGSFPWLLEGGKRMHATSGASAIQPG